jgi:stage III sporulation protein SpoIIIAA
MATFIFGRADLAHSFPANCRGTPGVHNGIRMDVLETCPDHTELVKAKQVITIEEWAEQGNALAVAVQDNAIKYPILVSPQIL